MTEISYITQNGQKIYFKDAAGREILAEKQPKLKAGKGITISNDGTISLAKAWKEITTENIVTVDLGSSDYRNLKITFAYLGNLSLLKNAKVLSNESGTYHLDFSGFFSGWQFGIYNTNGLFQLENDDYEYNHRFNYIVGEVIQQGFSDSDIVLEDTNEDFLYLIPKKMSIIEDNNITETLDVGMFIAFEFIENCTNNETNEQYKLLNYYALCKNTEDSAPTSNSYNPYAVGDGKIAERFYKRLVQSL